jgi:acetyl esterase/lipase
MTTDVARAIDPDIATALAGSPLGAIDFGTYTFDDLPGVRAAMAGVAPALVPTTTVTREVAIPDAGHDLRALVCTPPTEGSGRPCLHWIHGGGYLFGSGLEVNARVNRWVEDLDCVVISVDYRLAPEHPYPAPLDDCDAALRWSIDHADELGIDPARVVVGGPSAGGGLAAGLAIRARDRGGVQPVFQFLVYPMIDDRATTPSSAIEGAPVWSRGANDLGWRAYLGERFGTPDVPAEAAPARIEDVAGLPPAWIGVGSIDVFRDEDVTYASRLLAAGITTELHVYPGAPHGFEAIAPEAAVARACQRDINEAMRRALRPETVVATTTPPA